jgi:hypothetical protein
MLPQIKGVSSFKKPSNMSDKLMPVKPAVGKNISTFAYNTRKSGQKLAESPYKKKSFYKSYV